MGNFIQLHLLTNYGPSNLNRDDLGRPKTATVGGVQRLRVSSQSLKRAWRTSDTFDKAVCGVRTKEIGSCVAEALITSRSLLEIMEDIRSDKQRTWDASDASKEHKPEWEWAWKIASVFVDKMKKGNKKDGEDADDGFEEKSKKDKKSNVGKKTLKSEQMVFYYPEEIERMNKLIGVIKREKRAPSEKEINALLVNKGEGIDVGMFGRMMANSPGFNTEAAVQVAHAFTVHKTAVEDDYFSAVDDLNTQEEHAGSAHIGEAEFGAGLFYLYICIDRALLAENLDGNKDLAEKAIQALVETAATVSPTGKQNSFASRAYASYILAEKTDKQPRSLAVAFLKPVKGEDMLKVAVDTLRETRERFGEAYGCNDTPFEEVDTVKPSGTLEKLIQFCVQS
jgi:CRISPR system Cascade subunit CasC